MMMATHYFIFVQKIEFSSILLTRSARDSSSRLASLLSAYGTSMRWLSSLYASGWMLLVSDGSKRATRTCAFIFGVGTNRQICQFAN